MIKLKFLLFHEDEVTNFQIFMTKLRFMQNSELCHSCKSTHFLDRRSITSPPAAWIAAVDPVAVEIHIPLDQTLKENICIIHTVGKIQFPLELRHRCERIGITKSDKSHPPLRKRSSA